MTYLSERHSSTEFQKSYTQRLANIIPVVLGLLIGIFSGSGKVYAGTGNRKITVSIQPAQPHPGDDITLSFQIDNADSVYYFGLKLAYQSNLASFVTSQSGSLMGTSAIHIADITAKDTLGASTSRTSGAASGSGTLFKLTFHVNKNVEPGNLDFEINSINLRDSSGTYINTDYTSAFDTSIAPRITDAGLQFSSDTLIAGQNGSIQSTVLARGITNSTGKGNGIQAWIGFSTSDTNPSTWNDTSWTSATI